MSLQPLFGVYFADNSLCFMPVQPFVRQTLSFAIVLKRLEYYIALNSEALSENIRATRTRPKRGEKILVLPASSYSLDHFLASYVTSHQTHHAEHRLPSADHSQQACEYSA